MKRIAFVLVGLVLAACQRADAQPVASPTADDVLAAVQKAHAGVTDAGGTFRQEVFNTTFGQKDVSDGRLWIRRPGKMRWDYFAKQRKGKPREVAKNFISDGSTLYVVDRENKQVFKNDLRRNLLPAAITFLYGTGDLSKEFTPELDKSGTYGTSPVLRLTPKTKSTQYERIYLVVDPKTSMVRESIIVDSVGNTNHFWFRVSLKATAKDHYFKLDESSPALANYRIIDAP